MNAINEAISYILTFKAYIMLPMILFVFSVIFNMPASKAFKSSLTIGIGFIGIFIVFGYFVESIGPAIKSLVQRTGVQFDVFDAGWPSLAAIAWSYKLVPLLMLLLLAANIIMLLLRLTRTLNIDIWNFWHFILVGALVYESTGNIALSVAATLTAGIIVLKLADWCAGLVRKFAGLTGVTISTISAVAYLPLGIIGNSLLERIPFLNKINADPGAIKKKIGVLGEPMVIGFITGTLLGIASGYALKETLELAFCTAAVMYILPIMARILAEGIMPISESMKKFLKTRFPKMGEANIGLDVAVIVGNESIIVTGLLLMPVSLVLAFILPGVKFVPLGDLANIIGSIPFIVIASRGNIIRSVIISIPVIIGKLYVASYMASSYTNLALKTGFDFKGYDGPITSFLDGGNLLRFWIIKTFEGRMEALLFMPLIVLFMYVAARYSSEQAPNRHYETDVLTIEVKRERVKNY